MGSHHPHSTDMAVEMVVLVKIVVDMAATFIVTQGWFGHDFFKLTHPPSYQPSSFHWSSLSSFLSTLYIP